MMFLRRTGSGGAVLMVMCGRDGAFWYGADAARHRRTSSSGAIFMRGPEGSGAENKSIFTVQNDRNEMAKISGGAKPQVVKLTSQLCVLHECYLSASRASSLTETG